jgi:hypothetical protein
MKLQAQSSKPQGSSKLQASNGVRAIGRGIWSLGLPWSLELEVWSFRPAEPAIQ